MVEFGLVVMLVLIIAIIIIIIIVSRGSSVKRSATADFPKVKDFHLL